jgi:hypothetical protein
MKWWLVWLQDKDDILGYDAHDPDMAVCVNAGNAELAEKLGRIVAAAVDSWADAEDIDPQSYKLVRIVEATVKETGGE